MQLRLRTKLTLVMTSLVLLVAAVCLEYLRRSCLEPIVEATHAAMTSGSKCSCRQTPLLEAGKGLGGPPQTLPTKFMICQARL